MVGTYDITAADRVDRSITITTSDGAVRRHRFLATVRSQVEVSPPSIEITQRPTEIPVRMTLTWGERLTVREAEIHPPGPYSAELTPDEDDLGVTIHLRNKTTVTATPYVGTLFLRLAEPGDETLTVPLRIGIKAEPTLASSK